MTKMYEINTHSVNNRFSHVTVTPITILREGILPGCSAPSITARDANGRTFNGSKHDFYETEEAAWMQVKNNLQEWLNRLEEDLIDRQMECKRIKRYLKELEGE